MEIRAYIALHLGGTTSQETSTRLPSCLLLDNRLNIGETGDIYIKMLIKSLIFLALSFFRSSGVIFWRNRFYFFGLLASALPPRPLF